jgi:hypothetical protein
MQCSSCKAELTPEARTCPACGAPTQYAEEAESSPYHTGPAPYSEQVSYIDKEESGLTPQSPASGTPPPAPTSYQGNASGEAQRAPVQESSSNGAGAGQPSVASPQPPYPGIQAGYPAMGQPFPAQPNYPPQQAGYPPQPGYYQSGGQPFPPQPGYPPNPAYYQGMGQPAYPMGAPQGNIFPPGQPRQSHFVRNLVISLVGILVVVLLVVVGVLAFLLHQSTTASTTPSNTMTASSITTNDPQALYNQVMSLKPTVDDPLSAQNQTTWQALGQGSQATCTFNSGALHAKGTQGPIVGCLDTSDTYNNFAIQMQMSIIQGDAVGLAFRTDPVGGKSYAFAITPQNAYSLFSTQNGTTSSTSSGVKFLTAGVSQAINAGYNKPNQITIIARNSSIYLYINKQYLTTINDSTSSAGMIGAIVITKSTPADAAFSNLKIWKL